jgi:hypothetical protein
VDTIQPIKFDLDIYLEENVYICEEGSSEDFNALEWWKATPLKFRILSKMACDILSISITTVASEVNWVRALHGLYKSSKVVIYFYSDYYFVLF